MRFAHMADLHLGGWRDPKLQEVNLQAFEKAVDICIRKEVDFVLISGDLFDTSMPPFDILAFVSKKLNLFKKAGIPVYVISGSHDYSPSGKTILKVFENAELIIDVAKGHEEGGKLVLTPTEDKSGAKIVGMFGKKGGLEEQYYRELDHSVGGGEGYKVFMFHSGIKDYLPEDMKRVGGIPLSLLPKGFDYYAGGHIHAHSITDVKGMKIVFPGPLFPCNFKELWDLSHSGCGFFMVEDNEPEFIPLMFHSISCSTIDADGKTPQEVEAQLARSIEREEDLKAGPMSEARAAGKAVEKGFGKQDIVLWRVSGTLREGKPTDIDFRKYTELAYENGAYAVLRNASALSSKEYGEVKVSHDTVENLELRLIKEHAKGEKDIRLIEQFIGALDTEKAEGETNPTFEERVNSQGYAIIGERDLNKTSD